MQIEQIIIINTLHLNNNILKIIYNVLKTY